MEKLDEKTLREVAVVEGWPLYGAGLCREVAVVERWPFMKVVVGRWLL